MLTVKDFGKCFETKPYDHMIMGLIFVGGQAWLADDYKDFPLMPSILSWKISPFC